jgi:predicted nucleic acid-binding Zn ribbon protein
MLEINDKECLACGKKIVGRADKKFCDDSCRNAYNNTQKATENNYMRNVINILKKNRRVLEEVLGSEEMSRTTQEKLIQKGFNKQFHTHTYTNKKGDTYFFNFEYGYLPLENQGALVVKRSQKE